MLCDLKIMQLGGIHRVQLADIFGSASSTDHNRASFAINFGDRSGFKDEVPVGENLGDLSHDSGREGIFSFKFAFGFMPVLNGSGNRWKALGVILLPLFIQQRPEIGPLVDPGIQIGSALRGQFRSAFAAAVFTNQDFDEIVFVEGAWFVFTRGVGHLEVTGVPRVHRRHRLGGIWFRGVRTDLDGGQDP